MSTTPTNSFPQANLASVILPKIAGGTIDADFARALTAAHAAAMQTNKRASVAIHITVEPNREVGATTIRAHVSSKLPQLPQPAIQVHSGPNGELMTQLEFIMGGGKAETPLAVTGSPTKPAPVVGPAAPAPLAAAPTPPPLAAAPAAKPLATA